MSSSSSQSVEEAQKAFIGILNGLDNGATALNRSDLVKKGLALLASTTAENIMVDVEKKVAMSPPPEALVGGGAATATEGTAVEEGATVTADGAAAPAAAVSSSLHPDHIETTHTISAPCVVSVESSLSCLFAPVVLAAAAEATPAAVAPVVAAPAPGGKNNKKNNKNNKNNAAAAAAATEEPAASPAETTATTVSESLRISGPHHRLLLYRFLLNGLADITGERQLLMAAGPMFAMEATDDHKKAHEKAIAAILNGILVSGNAALKAVLKLTDEKGEDGDEEKGGEQYAFAKNVLLGLVLYFEQKTSSAVFTTASSSNSDNAVKSKQGRFFDLVTVLSFVVSEGLSSAETAAAAASISSPKDKDGGESASAAREASPTTDAAAEDVKNSSTDSNSTPSTEALFLSTLFTLLYRLVPIYLPLRGEEQLFAASALPDLLRLLLQYHDPILSLHLDQHPPLRRPNGGSSPSPTDDGNDNDNDALLEAKRRATPTNLSTPTPFVSVVKAARSMSDAAYQYLSGAGCSAVLSASVAEMSARWGDDGAGKVVKRKDGDNANPLVISEDAIALLDLIMLRYDDSHYFGCLSFIATVLLYRGEILKLTDGEAIAKFWAEFASGAFGDRRGISLTAEPIPQVEKLNSDDSNNKGGDAATATAITPDVVKSYASAVLAFQANASYKERLPPILEPLSGYLYAMKAAAASASSSSLPPMAAIVAVIVRNLAKNTPSSAKVFATAILSVTNTSSSSSSSSSSGGNGGHSDGGAFGDLAMGGGGSGTVADNIERQRAYVASFPVMPVTAEELVLVFPAGGASPTAAGAEASSSNGDGTVALDAASSARAPPSGGDPSVIYSSSHLQYLVLDSRAENSFLFARLPTAIHIGSGIGFDAQQLAATVFQLQDAWSSHLTIMGTGRSIVEELNLLKLIALRLIEKGFPNVSIVDGGFKACIPYLKAGQMEFVQSPQTVRDECAAREAARAAAIAAAAERENPQYQQQQQQRMNTSRTTLDSSEEIAGEIASQAAVLKEQAAVMKDKAAEGLKKTSENLSEAASTAATWGASVWGRFSSTVSEKIQKAKEDTSSGAAAAAGESGAAAAAAPAPAAAPAAAPSATSSSAVTATPPASSGFFSSLITKVKDTVDGSAAAADVGNNGTLTTTAAFTASSQQQQADVFVTSGAGANGGDDEDDDDDLGLIMTLAPTGKIAVPAEQSSAIRERISAAASVAPTPAPAPAVAVGAPKVEEEVADHDDAPVVPAAPPSKPASPVAATAPAAIPAAAKATPAKAAAASVIDDLFDDMLTMTTPSTAAGPTSTTATSSANASTSAAAGAASPTATRPSATAAPKAATASKSGANVFDDIFGDDF